MNKFQHTFAALLLFFTATLSAQDGCLHFKIQFIPASNAWGIYAKTDVALTPTTNTVTGSGQVTVVAPAGFSPTVPVSSGGKWALNAAVNAPPEAPNNAYLSFGFLGDAPKLVLHPDQETLLFTFQSVTGNTAATLTLIELDDPFNNLPNSASTNPGNDLGIFDFGYAPLGFYLYCCNYYEDGSTPCDPNVVIDTTGNSDTTIVINPTDTTGNGDTIIIIPTDTTGNGDTTIVVNPTDTTGNGDTTIIINPSDTTGNGDTTVIIDPTGPKEIDETLTIASSETTGKEDGNTTAVIDRQHKKPIFSAFPNPAKDWLNILWLEPAPEKPTLFQLYNGQGMRLQQSAGDARGFVLDISGLPAGVYILTMEVEGKVMQAERFVKE